MIMPGFCRRGLSPLPSAGAGRVMAKGLLHTVRMRAKKAMTTWKKAQNQSLVSGCRLLQLRVQAKTVPMADTARAQKSMEPGCPAQKAVSR